MKIRTAKSDDLDELVRINNHEAKWVGAIDREFFEKYLEIPFFNVAEENGNILAFMMAMDQSTDYDSENFLWFRDRIKRFYYVDRIVTNSSNKRKGIGKALYRNLIERRGGLPVVAEVAVEPVNSESIEFHEKFNFKEIGRFSADGKKTCIMYKLD